MKRWRLCREIDNILGTMRTCFVRVSKLSDFPWECNFKMEPEMQIQVQIGDTWRVFFMNPPRSLNEFITTAASREIPKTRFMDFGLLYENDEGEYVVLNDDPVCLRIAISSSKRIEGTDISRLKLRVFEGSSRVERTDPSSSTSDRPKARVCLKSDFLCNDRAFKILI